MLRIALLAAMLVIFAPGAQAAAPQPTRNVDISAYSGRWFEIARMPNKLQRGCLNGSVDYLLERGRLRAVQRCTRRGETDPRTFRSSGRILDPGANTKTRLTFAGFWSQEYWVIDHSREWAIIGDPSGRYLWIMSREPTLTPEVMAQSVNRVRALGYDAERLEFSGARR